MNARWLSLLPLAEPLARIALKALAHQQGDAMTPQEANEKAAEALARYRVALNRRKTG